MADSDLTYKVALAMTPGVTAQLVRMLPECGLSHEDFFLMNWAALRDALNINDSALRLDDMLRQEALFKARAEIEFMERHHIHALFIEDDEYPWRLLDIANPPVVLYQLGECDLNGEHNISIVGTRKCTAYGAGFSRRIVEDLSVYFPDLCVVSGLAYGIDAVAHTEALARNVATVGVVAHGLNTIYPAAHRDLAKAIIGNGGAILSEYPSGTAPYRNNFLERNRIVAAMSPVTVVAESPARGGAMSTAHDAFSYSRDVVALPGRVGDEASEGCNLLIRKNKAHLVTSAADIIEITGWHPAGLNLGAKQRVLFPDLQGNEKLIYDAIRLEDNPQAIDAIHQRTRLPISAVMAALSEMEFNGIVNRHPGNRYGIAF